MDVRDARGEYRVEPAPAATATGIPLGYKRTEVGVIPTDWHEETLLALANVMMDFRGRTPKKLGMTWGGGYIPALSAKNVKMGFIDFDEECYFGSLDLYGKWMTKGGVEFGDVIFTTEAPLGNVAQIPDSRKYILSQRTILLRANSQKADNAFLAQLMRSARFQSMLATLASGSTAKGIKRTTFEKIAIALPGPDEQRAIAEALSDVDALLGALDRLIAKKRDLKQAAMQQLLTGQTRLPGFTKEWEMKRLGDYAAFLKHGVNSRAELIADGEVKYLHYGDIHGADGLLLDPNMTQMPCLSKSKASGLDRLSDGDLVFADASEDVDGVGKSVELCGVGQTEVVSGMHTVAVRFDKEVLADGFKAYLQFIPAFRQHLRRLAAGTKVYATNKAHIASAEVLLPEAEEQIAVAAVLADMDAEIEALEARRAKTRDLKQAMMQELLTGRTRLI